MAEADRIDGAIVYECLETLKMCLELAALPDETLMRTWYSGFTDPWNSSFLILFFWERERDKPLVHIPVGTMTVTWTWLKAKSGTAFRSAIWVQGPEFRATFLLFPQVHHQGASGSGVTRSTHSGCFYLQAVASSSVLQCRPWELFCVRAALRKAEHFPHVSSGVSQGYF